jgi:hypothetical protein
LLQYQGNLSGPRPHTPDFERNYFESLLIVLDTLEQCLSGQPKDTTRFDENMNVKLLLREICQFIGKILIIKTTVYFKISLKI